MSTSTLPAQADPVNTKDKVKMRNIAIIAHVDHGKTTLVDALLRQSGTFRSNQKVEERVMDSMDLEREKGITIKAKNASFDWNGYHINIVDTPGHADFGGEVERIMKMIDGVFLLVDAHDGPQAQTKFVLRKALENGARAVVVINKIDRENARPHAVLDMVFELFLELHATDEQLDFPVIYASARDGYAVKELEDERVDMTPLFEAIVREVPPPRVEDRPEFQMLVSNLDYSDYLGRIALGRIVSGKVKVGDVLHLHRTDGSRLKGTVSALFGHQGLARIDIKDADAGDIIGLTGFEEVFIGDTLNSNPELSPLPYTLIDPPTISMRIAVNDGPMAGKEGKFLTARHIRERLIRETRTNVSLSVEETETAGVFAVSARGQMQIAVLVESMRREGFELLVSRPTVIFKEGEDGAVLEPLEIVYVEVPSENLGDVLQSLAARKGEVTNMHHHPTTVSVEALAPTRGLIGFETELINLTKGMGIMSHIFKEYTKFKGEIVSRKSGALVAMETGVSTAYALSSTQERGTLFVGAGESIYEGMLVGENSRADDLIVNPCKAKHLTNMRSQGDGKGIMLDPPVRLSLERSLEFIADDEFVEVTPSALRLRKKILDANVRKRASKSS
ncbi:MAG: translational GTPase TypA [Verrucomicrobiales bacterium]